jgi:hypothetical protein
MVALINADRLDLFSSHLQQQTSSCLSESRLESTTSNVNEVKLMTILLHAMWFISMRVMRLELMLGRTGQEMLWRFNHIIAELI